MFGWRAKEARARHKRYGGVITSYEVRLRTAQGIWETYTFCGRKWQTAFEKRRMDAAREGFYILTGFWGCRDVPQTVRKRVFHAVVVGAALSGMEVLTDSDKRKGTL